MWRVVPEPPCTASPIGLLSTSTSASSWSVIDLRKSRSAFAFEEFTPEEGLRGMLWGHPALLAATLLAAPSGNTLAVGDLPFHYVVDGDGDQVALPTTERLINLAAAEMLRRVGIDALMAHKGQPELRIAAWLCRHRGARGSVGIRAPGVAFALV